MLFLRRLVGSFTQPPRPRLILARPSVLVLALALIIIIPLIPVPLIPRTILVSGTILCSVPIPILVVPGALVAAGASIGARGRGGPAVGFGSVASGGGAVGVRIGGISFAFTVPEDGTVAKLFLDVRDARISGQTSVEAASRAKRTFCRRTNFSNASFLPSSSRSLNSRSFSIAGIA